MRNRKNFSEKCEKPLDNPPQVCYNKGVNERGKPPLTNKKLGGDLRQKENDTMANEKMTNRKALSYVLENCEVPAEVSDKLTAMIAALDKKNTAERKPTAKQTENEAVRAALVEFINDNFTEGENGFTCGDLLKVCPAVEGRSNQYVSAILSQAFKAGEVSKGSVKRRTYFAPVGVYETPAEDAE